MNVLVLVFGIFFFMLGLWQLDHLVAPIVWEKKQEGEKIEIVTLPFIGAIHMEYRQFYVLCYLSIFVGFASAIAWFAV